MPGALRHRFTLSALAVLSLAAPGVLAESPHRHPLVFLEVINPIVSEDGAQGSFRVRRSGPVDSRLVIRMFQQGQAVQAPPGVSVPQFVVIPPGQTEVTYALRAFDSVWTEGTRNLTLSLEPPTSPTNTFRLAPLHTAQFTILDSTDSSYRLPTIHVEVLTPFLDRQDPGPALFRITRRGLLGGELDVALRLGTAPAWRVDLATSGPSIYRAPTRDLPIAQPDTDYLPTAGIAHFASGTESVLVSVPLLPNRDPATDNAIDVRLAFQGSAIEGADYQPIPRVLTIPAGARSTRLQIHATPDSTPDPDRDLLIGIEPHPDYSATELPTAMIAIEAEPDTPTHLRPRVVQVRLHSTGSSIITVLPAAETFFRLDRSQDLIQWQTLGIFQSPSPVFEFVDHTATASPTSFYRAIPEPPSAMRP